MKPDVYEEIRKDIRDFRGMSKDCDKMLREKYTSVAVYTLRSILSLEMQQRMKVNHARLCSRGNHYYDKYIAAIYRRDPVGVLLRMSGGIGLSPALLARIILEKHCEIHELNASRSEVTRLLRDTTLIEDKDLAYEIYLCILYDDQYGPIADAVSHSVGQCYEVKLQKYVSERKIPFHSEEYLRSRGYDKTPDIKLEVPIAVNGHVINWIESKALFGNEQVHRKYIGEQFLSYWNRFGPGLVIYWFGFLDTLNQPGENKFIIMDDFPESITCMNPSFVEPLGL